MCGIAAILSPDAPVPAHELHRATTALRHRGPDGEGVWIAPSGRVGLGHTLLAITDPEGHQPIASEDGRLHIIHNGQFYDYRRIRASLEASGHRFRTRSDSEIALHLYEDLGPACLAHLRGQFAFVIWDEESGVLFAARDRFGLKPLFHAEKEGRLYLASEAKALLAAGIAPSWDSRGVYHALHACPDERISLFGGISQVPPGHFLQADGSGMRLERYWDLPLPPRRSRAASFRRARHPAPTLDGAIERVRDLTEESVSLRMVAAVPVGCLLSGGLDSSAVLGVAASCTDEAVAAFTVGFERRDYDESEGAREAATAAGANHTVVTASDADLADHFADAVFHAETLQYNTHGAARYLLSRGVRDAGYKSVLAGEGADEAFFGYEFLRAAAGAAGVPPRGPPRAQAQEQPPAPALATCLAFWPDSPASCQPCCAPPPATTPAWPPPHPGSHASRSCSRRRPRSSPASRADWATSTRCAPAISSTTSPDTTSTAPTTAAAGGLPTCSGANRPGGSSTSGSTPSSPTTTSPPTASTWHTGSRFASPSSTTTSSSSRTASPFPSSRTIPAKSTSCARRCAPTSPTQSTTA